MLIVAAAVARFYSISAESFWVDEIFTLETSAGNGLAPNRLPTGVWLDPAPTFTDLATSGGGVRGIFQHAREDTQGPVYYLMLNLWRHMLGSSELAVRSLSAICSLITVAMIGVAAHALATRRDVALLATSLAAVSGPQIVFAQEARPYAMVLLLVLVVTIVLLRIERHGFTLARGAAVATLLVLMMLTHYTAAAPATACFTYALVRLRGRERLQTASCFVAAGVVFLALWGPTLLAQRAATHGYLDYLHDDAPGLIPRTLDRALCQPLSMLITTPPYSTPSPAWRWVARAAGVALVLFPAVLIVRRKQPAILLPFLMMLFPIAQTTISDIVLQRQALELTRFSFLASAGAVMTAAMLIAAAPARWVPLLGGASVLAMLVLLMLPGAYDRQKPDTRSLAAALYARAQPGEVLLGYRDASQPWTIDALTAGITHYAGRWRGPVLVLESAPDDGLRRRLGSCPGVWLLSPTRTFPADLLPAGWSIDVTTAMQLPNMGTAARVVVPNEAR